MESCKEDRVPIYPIPTFPYEYSSVVCLSQFSKPIWIQYYQTHTLFRLPEFLPSVFTVLGPHWLLLVDSFLGFLVWKLDS